MESVESRPPEKHAPNKLGAWIDWVRRQRWALAAIALVPVALTLAIGIAELPRQPRYDFPCPIYPNGTVALTASLYATCPLEFSDLVAAVSVDGRWLPVRTDREIRSPLRGGLPVRYRIHSAGGDDFERELAPILVRPGEALARLAAAGLLAAILTIGVMLTTVRAQLPASLPFSLIHAAAGVGIVAAVAGWTSSSFEVPAALARAATGAALAHLALVFPQRRGIVELAPELIAAPYVAACILGAVEIDAAYGGSALASALAQRLIVLGIALGGLALCLGCLMTAQESRSHLARGQARVFLSGVAALLIPAAATWILGSPNARLTAMTVIAALMPFPVGYAISRYQLYDLDSSIRHSIARALYLSLWAAAIFLVTRAFEHKLDLPHALRHPTVAFATVYTLVLPIEAARSSLLRRLDVLLASQRVDWDRLGLEYSQRIAAQRGRESVARVACEAIRAGLSNAGVALFVGHGDDLHAVHAHGVTRFADASIASRLLDLSQQTVIDVNRLDASEGAVAEAWAAGIEAIARIASGGELLGCIAIFPERRGRLLSASEQLWIGAIAGHTASALLALRFEKDLRVSQRFAARGRTEMQIAHEIGKPLGVLELTARSLADRIEPTDPLALQLAKIAQLAVTVREVVQAALVSDDGAGGIKPDDLVQRSISELRSLHGDGRVRVLGVAEAPELPAHYLRLVRVLVNVLDNGIRASEPGSAVELCVEARAGKLVFRADDRGTGMTDDQLRQAFEPFTTFRPGGTGLGLPISREVAESLGGTLRLTPRLGGGMTALLEVPLVAPADHAGGLATPS